MKRYIVDGWMGFAVALFFALVVPLILHGTWGLLGYRTLTLWFPGVMDTIGDAIAVEMLLYIMMGLVVFLIYRNLPIYMHGRQTKKIPAALLAFLIGNLMGYAAIFLIGYLALSSWRLSL